MSMVSENSERYIGKGLWWATVVWVASSCGMPCRAADEVTVATGRGGQATFSGRIVDYTGEQLVLELADGRKQEIPSQQVLQVETQLTAAQDEAGARFASGDYAAALALYKQALNDEPRRWMRRRILADMVWCYRDLEQWGPAGEAFLLLVQSDPHTPHFAAVPLAWIAAEPSLALEQSARKWLDNERSSVAVLLGASHLLPTSARAQAVDALNRLTLNEDKRIARLAQFQLWRMEVPSVDPKQLDRWEEGIRQLPESLRAGPYFVLGSGRSRCSQWEDAALSLLRVPLVYSEHRKLAARALTDAGRALEELGWRRQAAELYREVVRDYDGSRPATEARDQLETLSETE